MMQEPNCSKRNCVHFLGARQPDGTEESEYLYCLAFPDGIPREIAHGDNKHLSPLGGQGNSIVYEREKE
jgi:hypothetical protein